MLFREAMIKAVLKVMKGRKCDCEGCKCHYGQEDAVKLVDAVGPVIVKEYASVLQEDVKTRMAHLKAAVLGSSSG